MAAHQHQPTSVVDDAFEDLADDLFRPDGLRWWLAGADAGLQTTLVRIVLVPPDPDDLFVLVTHRSRIPGRTEGADGRRAVPDQIDRLAANRPCERVGH